MRVGASVVPGSSSRENSLVNSRAAIGIAALGIAALPALAGCGAAIRTSTPGNPFGSKTHLSLADAQSDAMDITGTWMGDHHNTGWGTTGKPPCNRLSRAAFRCVVIVYLNDGRKYARITSRIAMGPSFIEGGSDIPHEDVVAVHRF